MVEFVNADTIAQGLAEYNPDGVAVEADSIMHARLRELPARSRNFEFETKLASRSLAPWLAELRGTGYAFHLVFHRLPSANFAVQRVADSVRMDGHNVSETTVRRSYDRGLWGGAQTPTAWSATAERARKEVEAIADPDERPDAIDSRDTIWQSLQHSLSNVRNDKCWYCECNDARCDRPVDHFRPKGAVAEDESHEGYWWLAFAWENFRYCCQFCNERRVDKHHGTAGGKRHHFPIWTDGIRARKDGDSLDDEKAMLLDPCCRTDPPFLWFDEHGQPAANPLTCGPKDSFPSQRVAVSIGCYHLDHFKVVGRRQVLYETIKRKVEDAEDMLRRYQQRADPAAQRSLANSIREIQDLLSPKAPLSRTAECALMSLRATHVVAEIALTGPR